MVSLFQFVFCGHADGNCYYLALVVALALRVPCLGWVAEQGAVDTWAHIVEEAKGCIAAFDGGFFPLHSGAPEHPADPANPLFVREQASNCVRLCVATC